MSDSKKRVRLSKREQRRQQVQREKRMRTLRIWAPISVIVAGLIIFAAVRLSNSPEVEGVTIVASAQSNQHDDELQIDFGGLPPMGGPHNPAWQNCGIYEDPVAPEYAIHSMEHGAVWITYHPDLPDADVAALQSVARGDDYLLLSPYPDQSSQIVLTVWDRQLSLTAVDDARIDEFVELYRRQRGPERTASCNGGIGAPIG